MKKNIIIALVCIFSTYLVTAQKYAIIDSRIVFENMPEYKQVQKQVDAQAATWQKEIDAKQAELDKLYEAYDNENANMQQTLTKKTEDQLLKKEKELRDMQKKRFGFEGDLFKKRQELMEPLQKRVAEAINRMAKANGYDLILDKSEGKPIIFADPKIDKTQELLAELRFK